MTARHMRDAARQDVPVIVSLLAEDEFGSQREAAGEPLPDEYWSAFDAIDRDPNNRLVVAEDDGEIIGSLQLTYLPHLAFQVGGALRSSPSGSGRPDAGKASAAACSSGRSDRPRNADAIWCS